MRPRLLRTCVPVPDFSFTITEHYANRLWIVIGQEHRTVTLDDGVSFFEWARKHWPSPRWTVQLDPGQLSPVWPRKERGLKMGEASSSSRRRKARKVGSRRVPMG